MGILGRRNGMLCVETIGLSCPPVVGKEQKDVDYEG